MKTIVCRLDLGFTRIAGYTLFDSETKEFQETTPRETEKLVKAKCVNGLVFDKNGLLVPDAEGWNLPNMKIKSGVGNYRDYNPENARGDTIYNVVGLVETNEHGKVYEIINNRCARLMLTEDQLLHLADFAWVGGIYIANENVEIYDGVAVNKLGNIGEHILSAETVESVENRVENAENVAGVSTESAENHVESAEDSILSAENDIINIKEGTFNTDYKADGIDDPMMNSVTESETLESSDESETGHVGMEIFDMLIDDLADEITRNSNAFDNNEDEITDLMEQDEHVDSTDTMVDNDTSVSDDHTTKHNKNKKHKN